MNNPKQIQKLDDVIAAIAGDAFRASRPLQFPPSRIPPALDPTVHAIQNIFSASTDFRTALKETDSPHCVRQLRERVTVCIEELLAVEDLAVRRMNDLEKE